MDRSTCPCHRSQISADLSIVMDPQPFPRRFLGNIGSMTRTICNQGTWNETCGCISIRGLTTEIKQEFGSAHYPNIYNAVLDLKDKNIIQIEKQGNASTPLLNFSNYLLPDMLFEIELQKKRDFLHRWPEVQFLLSNLDQ